LEKLIDEKIYQDQKSKDLLSTWLRKSESEKNILNNVHVGQILQVEYNDAHFKFTFPVVVSLSATHATSTWRELETSAIKTRLENENVEIKTVSYNKYIAPNLENLAAEMNRREELPEMFRQPIFPKLQKLTVNSVDVNGEKKNLGEKVIVEKRQRLYLVPLFGNFDEKQFAKHLSPLLAQRLKSWSTFDPQGLGNFQELTRMLNTSTVQVYQKTFKSVAQFFNHLCRVSKRELCFNIPDRLSKSNGDYYYYRDDQDSSSNLSTRPIWKLRGVDDFDNNSDMISDEDYISCEKLPRNNYKMNVSDSINCIGDDSNTDKKRYYHQETWSSLLECLLTFLPVADLCLIILNDCNIYPFSDKWEIKFEEIN
jgi:hypothetical protein